MLEWQEEVDGKEEEEGKKVQKEKTESGKKPGIFFFW